MPLAATAYSGQTTGSGSCTTKTFGKGRKCSEPGCETILSMYNPNGCCPEHPDNKVRSKPRTRGVKW